MIRTALLFLVFIVSINLSGQSTAGFSRSGASSGEENRNFTSLVKLQKNFLESFYFKSVTVPSELINGREYMPYFFRSGTNPQLYQAMPRTGTLFTKDMQFKNLQLMYDTYLDEVIYPDNSRMVDGRYPQIALNRDNIRGFNLYFQYDSLIFRYFKFPAEYAGVMTDGFYEVAYEGKFLFLVKHRSKLYNKEGIDKYSYSPEKYIYNGTVWARISSAKSFLKLFGNREKEVSAFLRKSKVKIQKGTRDQVKDVLKYVESSETQNR
jgi:hypothetical protein